MVALLGQETERLLGKVAAPASCAPQGNLGLWVHVEVTHVSIVRKPSNPGKS